MLWQLNVANFSDLVNQLHDVNVEEFQAQFLPNRLFVRLACNQPVGRFAYDAELLTPERPFCAVHFCKQLNSPGYVLRTAVQNFALSSILIEEREDFEGCRQRIAFPGSQKQNIAGKGRKDFSEKAFGASGPDEDDIQIALPVRREVVAPEVETAS